MKPVLKLPNPGDLLSEVKSEQTRHGLVLRLDASLKTLVPSPDFFTSTAEAELRPDPAPESTNNQTLD